MNGPQVLSILLGAFCAAIAESLIQSTARLSFWQFVRTPQFLLLVGMVVIDLSLLRYLYGTHDMKLIVLGILGFTFSFLFLILIGLGWKGETINHLQVACLIGVVVLMTLFYIGKVPGF